MKPGGGKRKGSAFEREVCLKLSLWVSGGKQTDCFWRSAMSGGRATVRNKARIDVRQAGDVCAVAPEGNAFVERYYVEIKAYKSLQIDRFVILNTGTLAKFWRETKKHARRYGRRPVLIAKQNGLPPLLITSFPNFTNSILVTCHRAHVYLLDKALKREE